LLKMTDEEFVSASTMKAISKYLWLWCLSVGSAERHSHQRNTDTVTTVRSYHRSYDVTNT
jgi:hypothetical protein